ncbi:cytochrome ubiquinol oxidase subunit I [Jonesia quinghaiensis]|uniref:cytochrome ubiquinol oxidase subunit I n=1 Tax=Jonesia quinghaiensis TaxID=262806 RepID=UPI0004081F3F|nr:cytochrome ubiquinol oxidase subunit I [Jonesia quinghaiensis]
MDALDIARWQFGITTVYHFLYVPLTIGLAPLVAIMQTMWVRTQDEKWLKLTKFFGKLLLINFAIGIVTGIVQEFQFGMNWNEYSRFVGDVFGAPLAMEALAAFFVESTFLGLWIFGWDKLNKKIHLACIWAVAVSTSLSAYFILAANSWMQHPVGAIYNPETGRAEMTDIVAVLTNSTVLAAFPHTITAAWLTAGTFVAGIAAFWMVKETRRGRANVAKNIYKPALNLGLVTMLIAGVGLAISGDYQAKLMFEQQPMKMAAAEALCTTPEGGAPFSILTIGDLTNDCKSVKHVLEIPGATSFLASGDFNAPLRGIDELQEYYAERYGDVGPDGQPIDYSPNLAITYWSFRLMIGFAIFSAALAAATMLLTRKGRVTDKRWFARLGLIAIPTPFLASSFGWIFTEMGRQPWVVAPNPTGVDQIRMLTWGAVTTNQSTGVMLASLILFTVIYTFLTGVWAMLIWRYMAHGAPEEVHDESPEANPDRANDADAPLSFAY